MNKNNLTQIFVKKLAYFYEYCLDSHWVDYTNVNWTGQWVPKILQPQNTEHLRDTMHESWDGDWKHAIDSSGLMYQHYYKMWVQFTSPRSLD
jgi:hypothetical protein